MFNVFFALLDSKKRTYKLKDGYKLTYYEEDGKVEISKKMFNSLDSGFGFYFKVNAKGEVMEILGMP